MGQQAETSPSVRESPVADADVAVAARVTSRLWTISWQHPSLTLMSWSRLRVTSRLWTISWQHPTPTLTVTVAAPRLTWGANERGDEPVTGMRSAQRPPENTDAGPPPGADGHEPLRRPRSPDPAVGLTPNEVLSGDGELLWGDGEVPLGEPPALRRTVEALVCLACHSPNPPMAARCRNCSALLSETNSEIRTVQQPPLGKICLSGGREEPLDADLLIGRNPDREQLGPHQRAVVHGAGDRSVSRRHIELRLEGWQVMALNLKDGAGTTVESRLGGCTPLPVGVPHRLAEGDTVQFGGVSLATRPTSEAAGNLLTVDAADEVWVNTGPSRYNPPVVTTSCLEPGIR